MTYVWVHVAAMQVYVRRAEIFNDKSNIEHIPYQVER